MLTITREQIAREVIVSLTGILDGQADFFSLIGQPPPKLVVNCGKINHVNSSGLKPWLTYFQKARERGSKLIFRECSGAIIEYFNAVSGFACGGTVESVVAPFFCKKCKTDFSFTIETTSKETLNHAITSQECPTCHSNLMFDEIPGSFFNFMK